MSTFKLKPEKTRYIAEIKTLDETHRKVINEFQKRQNNLPKRKQKLMQLLDNLRTLETKDASLYTNKDIQEKSRLKTEIMSLREEIYDIENNISEIEYYSKTDDLLVDYYSIIEQEADAYNEDENIEEKKRKTAPLEEDKLDMLSKLNKDSKRIKKVSKRRKKKGVIDTENKILTYFNNLNNTEKTDENKEIKKKKNERAKLLDEYMMLIDNDYASEKKKGISIIKNCAGCGFEKTLVQAEGICVCKFCGEVEMIIIEPEKQNYKDSNTPDKPGYPYKRSLGPM